MAIENRPAERQIFHFQNEKGKECSILAVFTWVDGCCFASAFQNKDMLTMEDVPPKLLKECLEEALKWKLNQLHNLGSKVGLNVHITGDVGSKSE